MFVIQMLATRQCIKISPVWNCQVRRKTAKFKPKVARSRPLKTPSALALDHFDFYYGPMFGERWPSIRLGLLSPNKYVAVTNTMSSSWEAHEDILKELGTMDLLQKIRGRTAEERIHAKQQDVSKQAESDTAEIVNEMNGVISDGSSRNPDFDELVMRTEAGLGEFQQPEGTLTPGELQMGRKQKSADDDDFDFEITGFEGEGINIPVRNHFIYYPRNLRIHTYDRSVTADFPPPLKGENQVPSWWLLDGGSVVPILAMGLEKGDSVLDVCSAPGGKSLLSLLTELPDKVVCNDFKVARLGQLKRALSTYIPLESEHANKVIIKRKDASNIATWDEINRYDKVLADVPCSTDRLAVNQDEGNLFSALMTNHRLSLPQLQTKILVNAIRSIKVGGSVIYSTCTLSALQNEAVVENAFAIAYQKFGIKLVEESLEQLKVHLSSCGLFRFSDQCKTGILVLPYIPSNFGPMYVCKLTRIA